MFMQKFGLCTLGSLAMAACFAQTGCRQGANPTLQLPPMNVLNPQTRVPPPATNSYSVPGGYYQGQASTAPAGGSAMGVASTGPSANSVAAANIQTTHSQTTQAQPTQVIGSGLASAAPTPLPTWTDQSARYAGGSHSTGTYATGTSFTSVAPASYVAQTGYAGGASPTAGATAGNGPTTSSPQDSGLRPQLRGMAIVDMTRVDKPDTGASESSQPQPWNAGPSDPQTANQNPGDGVASTHDLQAIESPSISDPQTAPVPTNSANLPWRRPLR
jgi:hypothetical protein